MLVILPVLTIAQDTIYKHKGKPIICKINTVKEGTVYYIKAGKEKEKSIAESKIKRHTYSNREYEVAEKHDVVYRDERIVFTHNFKLNGLSQDDIYERFTKYMSDPHAELKKTYKSKKPEENRIVAHVNMPSHYETFFGEEKSKVQYSLIFQANNNNVSLEITDVYISSEDANNSIETWHAHPGHFFRSQIDVLIIEFDTILKEIDKRLKSY
jgi:hypothetical protein